LASILGASVALDKEKCRKQSFTTNYSSCQYHLLLPNYSVAACENRAAKMSNRRNRHAYDNSNRAFLQVMMARSSITFEESKPILAAIMSIRGMFLVH
jgi:hypothetical protein